MDIFYDFASACVVGCLLSSLFIFFKRLIGSERDPYG